MAFFNAPTSTRDLGESDTDWELSSECPLGRLQLMHRRLPGEEGNPKCNLANWRRRATQDGRG